MIAKIILSNSSSSIKDSLISKLEKLGVSKNSPDVMYWQSSEKLGIEQMKKIKEFLSFKPHTAQGKTVVLENGENLTIEAQNSLLKTLEELTDNNVFLIGALSDANFLPTILSRCEIIKIQDSEFRIQNEAQGQEIEKLLNSSTEQRFEYIEKLKEKEEFLYALITFFHQKIREPKQVSLNFLKELLWAEGCVKQNVNGRAILEYLMLTMPKLN